MHRLMALLVLVASGTAPLLPLVCTMWGEVAVAEAVAHGHGDHGAVAEATGHPASGHEGHQASQWSDASSGEDSQAPHSHSGDMGCRGGATCGSAGLLVALDGPPSPLAASRGSPPVHGEPGPTAYPGHDTPPPRLPV